MLAHSVKVGGNRIRKGKVLQKEDIELLSSSDTSTVVVARLDPDDVHEDGAAQRLAHALVPDPARAGLRLTTAHTGRVNLVSEVNGIAEIDAAAINALNRVDPMITVATVPEWCRMEQGGLVATVKIISYAVPESQLILAEDAARAAIRMRPTAVANATLIQTTVATDDGEKGHRALHQRLSALGVILQPKSIVPHDTLALARALKSATGDVLFILTGSATSDIRDTAPEALRLAGGTVRHFGMPVDPGNLLFIGELNGTPVIGLPGCARSPALNGADWVLERICCGIPVMGDDIMGMGVGGLLKEIPTRPAPRRRKE